MKIRMHIKYDGTDFHGWQKQKTTNETVQAYVEKALSKVFDEDVNTIAAGRTDAGVHAYDQVVHFDCPKPIEKYDLKQSLNKMLKVPIAVTKVMSAPDDFHALLKAESKTYRYYVHNSKTPPVFRKRYCHWLKNKLDLDRLNNYSKAILGEHDFKSFQTTGTDVPSTIREVTEAHWRQITPEMLEFSISAKGFLKQMVRNIVGSQLDLHHQGSQVAEMTEILNAKDRQAALGTAPAQGLFLFHVEYSPELDNKCRKI